MYHQTKKHSVEVNIRLNKIKNNRSILLKYSRQTVLTSFYRQHLPEIIHYEGSTDRCSI